MKWNRLVVIGMVLVLSCVPRTFAQEKPQAAPDIPLKVLVVFNEFDGEKKVSSMPYTLSALSSDDVYLAGANLRMGIKVPILAQGKEAPQVQYLDVGTDIDCRVKRLEEGRFSLSLIVRRSSVHLPEGLSGKESTFTAGELSGRPVLRDFTGKFAVILRDAETKQTTVATDPVSGHVLKVEVTLNVVK
jgi:hypothetical protein